MNNARGYYVEPWLIYNTGQVQKQLIENPNKFVREIEDLRKSVSESINYKWGNTHHHMWSPGHRHLLAFQVTCNTKGLSLNVWTTNSESLASCGSGGGKDWEEKVKAVFRRIALIDEGQAHCSDCQEIMSMDEKGGRYFGGIYCQSCWDGKWKAVEAKETYD